MSAVLVLSGLFAISTMTGISLVSAQMANNLTIGNITDGNMTRGNTTVTEETGSISSTWSYREFQEAKRNMENTEEGKTEEGGNWDRFENW